MKYIKDQKGFTLIELLLVIGLFAILTSFVLINALRPQISSSVISNTTQVSADLRHQQLQAMVGKLNQGSSKYKGVYFETDKYILFNGDSYNASDSNNFEIEIAGVAFSDINLPSSQIVFAPVSGEVSNYSSSANSVTLQYREGFSRTISINEYGAITIN